MILSPRKRLWLPLPFTGFTWNLLIYFKLTLKSINYTTIFPSTTIYKKIIHENGFNLDPKIVLEFYDRQHELFVSYLKDSPNFYARKLCVYYNNKVDWLSAMKILYKLETSNHDLVDNFSNSEKRNEIVSTLQSSFSLCEIVYTYLFYLFISEVRMYKVKPSLEALYTKYKTMTTVRRQNLNTLRTVWSSNSSYTGTLDKNNDSDNYNNDCNTIITLAYAILKRRTSQKPIFLLLKSYCKLLR
jgi:hypothetical protein